VNGFFSVIGSVLTTVLSMSYGFRAVLLLGFVAYLAAAALLRSLSPPARL
jgi:NaMN:DMB phosphoribosyltransferase